jgi:uncharacterized protein
VDQHIGGDDQITQTPVQGRPGSPDHEITRSSDHEITRSSDHEISRDPRISLSPVAAAERLSSVDVVRGVAVLGILLMNIVGFGFVFATYADPTVAGGATGMNFWVYAVNAVLVDGKMRGIFSLVFGAGVIILTARAVERGAAAEAADIHYRRMFWLMLFGTLHAYLLWWGEILYPYALMGLLLYPMRKLSVRGLTIAGSVLSVLLTLGMTAEAFRAVEMRDAAAAADAAQQRGETLGEEQTDAQREWKERLELMKPDAAEIARVNAAFQGSYIDVVKEQSKAVVQWHFTPYYFPLNWDMLLMMFFGMAMMKSGILAAGRSFGFYTKMAFAGYAIGLPLSIWNVQQNAAANFDHLTMGFNNIVYEPARIAVCFGHVAVVMMIVKAGALRGITSRLAAVGQMALSNYILQSVICSAIFYGYGFGLFGTLQRYQVYFVVLGCWLVHLTWSPIWLRYYRFGPLEWGWRSLTYWQRQPMRRARVADLVGSGG